MTEVGAEIKSLEDTLQESMVNPVKGLFLVKANDGCRELFVFSKINRVSEKKEVFKNTTAPDATSLILAGDIRENLAYSIQRGFCRCLIIKVQKRDRSPIFEQ